jgi:transcriptional regulator with XRE-family HTH domain
MRKHKVGDVTFYGEFADVAANISDEEWAFRDYANDISNKVYSYMKNNNISKSELASRIETSKAFVTKVLNGDANMTFKTFTKILHAIDAKAVTIIVNSEASDCWSPSCWNKFVQSCSQRYSYQIETKSMQMPSDAFKQMEDNAEAKEICPAA